MTTAATGTARPDVPLTSAWFATALVVGPVGYLLFALSERSGDRLLGVALTTAAVLAGVTGATALATGRTARPWSLLLSAALVAVGLAAVGVVLNGPAPFVSDALLLGVPPVVGGILTGALALRGRSGR
jgi:hypothetical protein